jgi:hypothetical protein
MIRGIYRPPETLMHRPHYGCASVEMPMVAADDAHGIAHYRVESRDPDGTLHCRLASISEYLTTMSPREKAEQFTDQARFPPLDALGRIDFVAWNARREREWHEMVG